MPAARMAALPTARGAAVCCRRTLPAPGAVWRSSRAAAQRFSAAAASKGCEHSAYIADIAGVEPPAQLPALLRVLTAQGESLVPPSARGGLHPLIVPLSRAPDGQLTALLRWPTTPDAFFPLQLVRPVGGALSLRARSAAEYMHRALAEEDAGAGAGGARPVAEALRGEVLPFAYTPGAAASRPAGAAPARHSALDVYLARAAGKFDDVARRLVAGHLAAGDTASALVTVDWYSGGDHFKGWSAPAAFAAHFLAQLGRGDEARDAARTALARGPFWSLGEPLAPTAALAGFAGRSAADIKSAVADGGIAIDPAMKQTKTPAQRALEAAELALDRVSAGEASWDDVAGELTEAYAAAGLPEMARFVGARPRQ